MISANAKDDIRKLVLSRRSYLGTWFDTDKPGVFEETNKRKAILE
jgi:hypothetical protein